MTLLPVMLDLVPNTSALEIAEALRWDVARSHTEAEKLERWLADRHTYRPVGPVNGNG